MLYKISLGLHIASGILSLVSGLIAILSKKGLKVHRLSGMIFFISMLVVAASAIFISILKSNQFLLLIGIFAFYQDYSGFRAIRNKQLKPSWLDWFVLIVAGVNAFFMIYSMNLVLMVFGGICSYLVIGSVRIFILTVRGKEIPKLLWLSRHIGMMLGAYIATLTAFLVVNVRRFEPAWLPWLLPSMIGVPLILYWTRKYTLKPGRTLVEQ